MAESKRSYATQLAKQREETASKIRTLTAQLNDLDRKIEEVNAAEKITVYESLLRDAQPGKWYLVDLGPLAGDLMAAIRKKFTICPLQAKHYYTTGLVENRCDELHYCRSVRTYGTTGLQAKEPYDTTFYVRSRLPDWPEIYWRRAMDEDLPKPVSRWRWLDDQSRITSGYIGSVTWQCDTEALLYCK